MGCPELLSPGVQPDMAPFLSISSVAIFSPSNWRLNLVAGHLCCPKHPALSTAYKECGHQAEPPSLLTNQCGFCVALVTRVPCRLLRQLQTPECLRTEGMYMSLGGDKNPVLSAQFKLKRRGPRDEGLVQNPKLPPGATIYLSWWLQQAGRWHKSR